MSEAVNCIQLFITELDSALTHAFRKVMYLKQALFNRQMSVRSFALMQKNQKFPTFWLDPESSKEVKAAPASLLTPFIPLFALQTRFAQTGNALGRSIPVARLTLTSRGQSFPPPSSPQAKAYGRREILSLSIKKILCGKTENSLS